MAILAMRMGLRPTRTGGTAVLQSLPMSTSTDILKRHGAHLPHWTKKDGIYSITFRLADSLPQTIIQQWKLERKEIQEACTNVKRQLSQPERVRLHILLEEKIEQHLHKGYGSCWMKQDAIAEVVANAFKYFDGNRYTLLAWCIMPNHVHVVIKPHKQFSLSQIIHSWKSFTAKEANKILKRTGTFWSTEYYDHLIRDERDLLHQIRYVCNNPDKEGLKNWKWCWRTPRL